MKAVELGCYDIVKELDKAEGTDFRTKNRYGSTLIEIARKNNHAEMVEFLKQRNKKVERCTRPVLQDRFSVWKSWLVFQTVTSLILVNLIGLMMKRKWKE